MLFRTPSISPQELHEKLAAGDELTVIDVREQEEWDEARIEGTTHMPLHVFGAKIHELDTSQETVFVCHSGARSAQATKHAAQRGCDAYNLKGGIVAWHQAGLPLAFGTSDSQS